MIRRMKTRINLHNKPNVNENQTLEKNIDEKAICVIIFVAQFMHGLCVA